MNWFLAPPALTMLALLLLGGCGHMAVSYSPTPLTLGDKAAPKAETTEAAASTTKEGS